MKIGDIKFYVERWQAVAELELEELQASSIEKNWRKLNAIRFRAIHLGLENTPDDHEMDVFHRWAKLKANK